ncbi:hypothetical protein J3U96_13430 [Stenotrophomonas maltophilia]|nr:hypothetical protein J3U96_13430 [Stenotrophomonas maltophilia]
MRNIEHWTRLSLSILRLLDSEATDALETIFEWVVAIQTLVEAGRKPPDAPRLEKDSRPMA